MDQTRPLFWLFSLYLKHKFYWKNFSRIRTRILGIEGVHTDHHHALLCHSYFQNFTQSLRSVFGTLPPKLLSSLLFIDFLWISIIILLNDVFTINYYVKMNIRFRQLTKPKCDKLSYLADDFLILLILSPLSLSLSLSFPHTTSLSLSFFLTPVLSLSCHLSLTYLLISIFYLLLKNL